MRCDVVAQALLDPLDRHRRPHPGEVPVDATGEVAPRSAGSERRCAAPASPDPPAASCARRRTRPRGRRPGDHDRTAGTRRGCRCSARITVVPGAGTERHDVHPERRRSSTNQSNSSGGSIFSTTTVIWWPCSAIQRPAHSQPPRCGSDEDHAVAALEAVDDVARSRRRRSPARPSRATGSGAGSSRASSGRSESNASCDGAAQPQAAERRVDPLEMPR